MTTSEYSIKMINFQNTLDKRYKKVLLYGWCSLPVQALGKTLLGDNGSGGGVDKCLLRPGKLDPQRWGFFL